MGSMALLPGHPRRGRGQVRGSVSPAPRVGRGREGDRDVVAQQRDGVGLRGMRGSDKRGNVLVRVRDPLGPLVKARTVSMDRRGRVVQDLARGWSLPRVITVPLPCNVRAHKWGRFSPIRQRHCVHCVTIALIVLRVGVRLCACISRIRQTDRIVHVVDLRCRGEFLQEQPDVPIFRQRLLLSRHSRSASTIWSQSWEVSSQSFAATADTWLQTTQIATKKHEY